MQIIFVNAIGSKVRDILILEIILLEIEIYIYLNIYIYIYIYIKQYLCKTLQFILILLVTKSIGVHFTSK